MRFHVLGNRHIVLSALILFGLAGCLDLENSDGVPTMSAYESELNSNWWSPVIGGAYPVLCGSPAHTGGAYHAADVSAPYGAPVYAAHGGLIQKAGWDDSGYGNLVKLSPPDGSGKYHYYAHLSDIHPSVKGNYGAFVSKGQLLGWVGNTGNVTGPHLHFHAQNDYGAAVTLVGMTGFTANPLYPQGWGTCGSMGR